MLKKFCSVVVFLMGSTPVLADYSTHPGAQAFVKTLVQEHQFEESYVLDMLRQAEKKQSILDAIARPAEKTKPWKDYRKIFLGEPRIQQGIEFWNNNKATLARAAEEFGVDEQMIVAILGIETRYGKHTGGYRVLDALATLGFDYTPRGKFFLKELENAFLLAREQKVALPELTGSYAGAMGYGQFIPSSYRAYAVDFDGDGKADIWNNPVDAIGSIANYFRRHGWQRGEIVVTRAHIAGNYDKSVLNEKIRPHFTLSELAERGYTPVNAKLKGADKAVPLSYDGEYGKEIWLGFNNFYAITRYNRSQLYAMAAYQLSEELRYGFEKQVR
ncbi:lytic murein transglycosylase B [Teredinibacter turnerae]|uniref:Lytic murein transglycosylase B n=1 Tax=Teredinibacter turnerae (strain ATCC 39867 / T7901) TaxID=377629 RepID=C5BNN5_TERTT|nr:lytic murein transglycosylase B [Teredinibacter turnerae]ACR13761.1 lytic murein transglycosylase B [Teredinibacter turnerae T7901]